MSTLIRKKVVSRGKLPIPEEASDFAFITELQYQSSFGIASFNDIQIRIGNNNYDDYIFALCHMQLVFSGNISKILFPGKQSIVKVKERSFRIQESLSLPALPNLKSKSGRNYVEHFDERMERYVGKSEGILIYRHISLDKPNLIEIDGRQITANYMIHFNTSNNILSLYDEEVDLAALYLELSTVYTATNNYLKRLNRS